MSLSPRVQHVLGLDRHRESATTSGRWPSGPPSRQTAPTRTTRARRHITGLTDRQLQVVQLLAAGLTNKEIARRLGVTPKTVMHHTVAIYQRLGVRGRSEAVAWAIRAA